MGGRDSDEMITMKDQFSAGKIRPGQRYLGIKGSMGNITVTVVDMTRFACNIEYYSSGIRYTCSVSEKFDARNMTGMDDFVLLRGE